LVPSLVTPALTPGSLAAMPQPEIDGRGVVLRPWQPADRDVVIAAYADPDVQRWHSYSMTEDEADVWIATWPYRWRRETGAGWAVVEDGAVAGQISLRRIELGEGLAEVSYWVLGKDRGRGVAGRALATLADWCFGTLGLHRVELAHSTVNVASCRVAERAGFAAEGTRRGQGRHADGWHDMHQHARLAGDD
jgi:RimJ/RimL family protein N-acetyltransferase